MRRACPPLKCNLARTVAGQNHQSARPEMNRSDLLLRLYGSYAYRPVMSSRPSRTLGPLASGNIILSDSLLRLASLAVLLVSTLYLNMMILVII